MFSRKRTGGCNRIFMVCLSGILVAHYLQSLSPALVLGGELVYHRRPGEEGTVTSFMGRYTGEIQTPHVWTLTSVGAKTFVLENESTSWWLVIILS